MSKRQSNTLNRIDIEMMYHDLLSQGYSFTYFINKRCTRIKVSLMQGESIVGTLDAEKVTQGDTYTVTYCFCNQKGLGKILYYYAMNFIYPCCLTHEEHISESAQSVWSGIYECLGITEGTPCSFQF